MDITTVGTIAKRPPAIIVIEVIPPEQHWLDHHDPAGDLSLGAIRIRSRERHRGFPAR